MYGDVKLSLVDPAFSAVANDPEATDTYHKLIKFLRRTYGVRSPKVHYVGLLSKLTQKELETGSDYVGRFTTLRRRLNDSLPDGQTFDETTFRTWFKSGLRSGFKNLLEQHIKFSRDFVTLNEALALVRDSDKLVQRMEGVTRVSANAVSSHVPASNDSHYVRSSSQHSSRQQQRSKGNGSSSSTPKGECWQCGLPGHYRDSCPNGDFRYCSFCKITNSHVVRQCRKKENSSASHTTRARGKGRGHKHQHQTRRKPQKRSVNVAAATAQNDCDAKTADVPQNFESTQVEQASTGNFL